MSELPHPEQSSSHAVTLTPSAGKVLAALRHGRRTRQELLIAVRPMSPQGLDRALNQLAQREMIRRGGWDGTTYGWAEARS